jgi:hypothetical protein
MIEEVEVTETVTGKAYEFALEKGVTDLEVVISPRGEVLKNEIIREGEVDDDGE